MLDFFNHVNNCISAGILTSAGFLLYLWWRKPRGLLHPTQQSLTLCDGKFANLSYGKTHYKVIIPKHCDENLAPIVLVHGIASGMVMYDCLVEYLLSMNHKIIYYDLYGRGGSDSPDLRNDLCLFTSQLNELLIYLENEIKCNKIILIGTSMGGAIVSHYASLFPHKISKLILIAPFGVKVIIPYYQYLLLYPIISDIIEYIFPKLFNLVGKYFVNNGFSKDDIERSGDNNEYIDRFKRILKEKGFIRSFCSTARYLINKDNIEDYIELENLKIDSCVLWGDEDKIVNSENINILKEIFPSAEYHILNGCGHGFIFSRCKDICEIISNFINKNKNE